MTIDPLRAIRAGVCAGALLACGSAGAAVLEEIVVTATRLEKSRLRVPAAVGTVDERELQLARQQLGLDEALNNIPGVFMLNRYNFAQDLRVSIRGFGARSNFGIRGVKIYVDGIPATTPDGQAGVDGIDIGATARVEVIRGPTSSQHGAASGGVISLHTQDGPEHPYAGGRVTLGEYASNRYQLEGGGQYGPLNAFASLSHLDVEGFRGHSELQSTILTSKFRYDLGEDSELTVVLGAVDSPIAKDPGGLNAAEVAADRSQGRARNIQFDGGEALAQQRLGVTWRRGFGQAHELRLRGYLVNRTFENKLPFVDGGAVAFDRSFFGGGVEYTWNGEVLGLENRFIAGFDIDDQNDDRRRRDNNNGILGPVVFAQEELVQSRGVFFQNELLLLENLELTLGGRYDEVEFEVEDDFLADGDDSGDLQFEEFSPMVGLWWQPHALVNLYGTISTSFETPTTTEFANPAQGGTAAGFNPNLGPQTATNYELGVKGLIGGRIRYDLAWFTIDVEDELVAFELPGLSGRSFFENAGSSTRQGVEAGVTVEVFPGMTGRFAYTYSDFEFDRFRSVDASGAVTVFDGNRIPGVPEHQFHAQLSYTHPGGLFVSWDFLHVDSFFADNANTTEIDPYQVANLRFGYNWALGGWEATPFFGINNMFDEEYNSNVRLNAGFGRYFEPAPDRNVYGGLSLRYRFGP